MSGLEAIVLLPLVYGCVHLGKKVLDQSRVIDVQNELIGTQQQTITALQTPGPESSGSDSPAAGAGAQRWVAFSSLAVAASLVAYNVNTWYRQTRDRASTMNRNIEPSDTYKPTTATGEQDECKVCCEHQRDTLLVPCHHFALCWPCAQRIMQSSEPKCPLCRVDIVSAQFTFVA
jgi:hypothetical protein